MYRTPETALGTATATAMAMAMATATVPALAGVTVIATIHTLDHRGRLTEVRDQVGAMVMIIMTTLDLLARRIEGVE